MALHRNRWPRILTVGLCAVVLLGLAVAFPFALGRWKAREAAAAPAEPAAPAIRLVTDQPDAFVISPGVVQTLKVQTAVVQKATHPRPLKLTGSLNYDQNLMYRARSRFAGELTQIGTVPEPKGHPSSESTEQRPLRPGDRVEKDQLLAVIWSKELGEKKSELVDALSQWRVDKRILDNLEKSSSAVPERSMSEQRAKVALDRNAILRCERTLGVYRLTREEIEAIKKEAGRIFDSREKGVPVQETDWARVEVRARFAGTVMEKNVNVGDYVDVSSQLYTIANLSRLAVQAHAYEEDLPALQGLTPDQRRWTVRIQAEPDARPLPGAITTIGDVIDPTQHTAFITGYVDNSSGLLRVGQFITATVDLPPPAEEVEIPTAALIEDGSGSWVVIRTDAAQDEFALRRVVVARRTVDWISLRTRLRPNEERRGIRALQPGDTVVTSGALELASALKDLQGAAKK
jgi:cobalt-zinc-cadmium efflux system membrane fusion protein